METKKQQYLGFIVILLIIGYLNYFRRLTNGYKLSKTGRILYLATMVVFTVGTMFVLYYTNLNNIVSFAIGLVAATMSEHIAKLIMIIGDNFNPLICKLMKKFFGIDISEELNGKHCGSSEKQLSDCKECNKKIRQKSGAEDECSAEKD